MDVVGEAATPDRAIDQILALHPVVVVLDVQLEGGTGIEVLKAVRQAVAEARLQGISPFCLTVDRQAADYIPHVFGPRHYALLPRPELLPHALLDWLRRLVTS
jgi:nitric oxide reductase NorD protein